MNAKIEKVNVYSAEDLNALYKDNAITIVGLKEESIKDFVEWIERYTEFKPNESNVKMVYVVKGNTMNTYCGLAGQNNRYKEDVTIVAVKLEHLNNPMTLVIPRFEIGARWFNDIVDNNRRLNK